MGPWCCALGVFAMLAPPARAVPLVRGGVGVLTLARSGFEHASDRTASAVAMLIDLPTSNSQQHAFVGARGWWGGDGAGWGAGLIAGPEVSFGRIDANLGVGLGTASTEGWAIWSGLSVSVRLLERRSWSAGIGVHGLWAVAPHLDAFGALGAGLVIATR